MSIVGMRLTSQNESGRPTSMTAASQAITMATPVSHQPTRRYQTIRTKVGGPVFTSSTRV
jgi:hypothetical protein